MSDQIEIKVDGRKLTPEKFLKAVEAFFSIVEGVGANISGSDHKIEWVVEVDKGSAILRTRATNPSAKSNESIVAICSGLHSLQSGVRKIPTWFTNSEVKAAKTLAALVDGENIQTIAIRNGAEPQFLSDAIVQSADAIINAETYQSFGSIEGKVDSLSDKHGFSCSITDPTYGREIVCYFTNSEAENEAYKGFRKRVMAVGLIRYGKEGRPTSISVDKIRIFPDESELPSVEEIQAIYKLYAT